MEKSVPSYPVIILNIYKRKKYNFQILLLGQTLVTELRSMEKYRKELRLSKCRMAHKDEVTATAWERLSGAVPRQNVMWLQTPQTYSRPGLWSSASFSATIPWLQSIRFSWIQHDSKALSKGSLRATLKQLATRKDILQHKQMNSTPQGLKATQRLVQEKQMTRNL